MTPLQTKLLSIGSVLDAVTRSENAFVDEISNNIDNVPYVAALIVKKLLTDRELVATLNYQQHVRGWLDSLIEMDYDKQTTGEEPSPLELFSSCLSIIIACLFIFERDDPEKLISAINSKLLCINNNRKKKKKQKRKLSSVDDDDEPDPKLSKIY
uniref:Uncharacterized protein n=1 Tax=Carcinus maenas virus 1 TaxID=2704945 RepID=A0A6G9HD92_9VIRU|nr:hypothetical protein [Carcinus maenas virus 1]